MKKEKSLYDLKVLPTRIAKLRKEESKLTLEQLSKEMGDKIGEYISTNTLGKYEKVGEAEKMRIGNLIAIANFYDVPLDYLLGRTDSTMYEYKEREIANKLGLSDKSIKKLTAFANNKLYNNNTVKLDLINYIIESDIFLSKFSYNLLDFYKSYNDKNSKDEEKRKNHNASRYALSVIFEEFIESSYRKLYESKILKPHNLFDIKISKQKKSNKKEKK